MSNYAEVMAVVASNKNVVGVAPNVYGQVLLKTQPVNGKALLRAPVVRGIDPQAEATVSTLASNILPGGELDLSRFNLVIGAGMASDLDLHVGDQVAILSERHLEKMIESHGRSNATEVLPDDYQVRGIFDAGHYEFNSLFVFISLEKAQAMFGLEETDEIHNLTIAIQDPFQAQTVARELQQSLGEAVLQQAQFSAEIAHLFLALRQQGLVGLIAARHFAQSLRHHLLQLIDAIMRVQPLPDKDRHQHHQRELGERHARHHRSHATLMYGTMCLGRFIWRGGGRIG
jgi:lipoprotein-releasing system permease protein